MYSYHNNIFIVYMHIIECHLPMNITSILYYNNIHYIHPIYYTVLMPSTQNLTLTPPPNQTQGPRTII